MSIINFGNVVALVGIVVSAYAFSRGVPAIGLFFVLLIIAGLLMNPPKPL